MSLDVILYPPSHHHSTLSSGPFSFLLLGIAPKTPILRFQQEVFTNCWTDLGSNPAVTPGVTDQIAYPARASLASPVKWG